MSKNKDSKKRKKFKINWSKFFVWVALIAMVGSAFAAILSPLFSRSNANESILFIFLFNII